MTDFFDQAAASWDANPGRVMMTRRIVDAFVQRVPLRGDMRVLDYGCGTGLVTLALVPHVREIVAADSSEGMLAELRKKLDASGLKTVRPLQLDLETDELSEGDFDLIISSMTFHHLRQPEVVVAKLAQGLAPEGLIAVLDLGPGAENFHEDNTGVYHPGFAPEELRAMFLGAELAEVGVVEALRAQRPHDGVMHEFTVLLATGRRP